MTPFYFVSKRSSLISPIKLQMQCVLQMVITASSKVQRYAL